MQEIPIELENLIKEQFNKINEKINGLNFLETFKQSFIPSFSSLMETSNLIEKLQDNSNLIIEYAFINCPYGIALLRMLLFEDFHLYSHCPYY